MANIVVKDLNENVELDRQAMRTIIGCRSSAPGLGPVVPHTGHFQNPLSFGTSPLFPGPGTGGFR